MSIARSLLTGGPAYVAYGSSPVSFQLADDSKVETAMVTDVISAALFGKFDETYRDMIVRASGTPLFYDPSVTLGTFFPYISQANVPIGGSIFGTTDVPVTWTSNNGDNILIRACAVGKMPGLYLGVDKPMLGPLEIWGVVGTGLDPSSANSYYTVSTSNSFAAPAIPGTSVLGRQKWTAAFGSVTGFTSFQAQEGWEITHELELVPITIQGRTVDFHLASYRSMAKCKPTEPTMANIDAALKAQGSLVHGGRLSTNAHDLVITGATSGVVTVKNAVLKTAGYVFGAKPLRQDQIGFVGTLAITTGTPSAALTLA
jgi:hypothetical protein